MTTYAKAPSPVQHVANADAKLWLSEAGLGVWNFFMEVGRRRAGAEMLRLSRSFELAQPDLAAQLRECARENDRRA